jgi:DNA polymerase-1
VNFPQLSGPVAIDVETHDPDLMELGPGSHRGAYIVGVSVCTAKHRAYYPVAHERGKNFDKDQVFAWLRRELKDQPKIGANLIYDLEMLAAEGVEVPGPYCDIQLAEPLIDETQFTYNLDRIARQYLKKGKSEEQLRKWILKNIPGAKPKHWKSHIWQAPGNIVAPYAIADVVLPFKIWPKQYAKMRKLDLLSIYDTEQSLLPVLLHMRQNGIKVNVAKAKRLKKRFEAERDAILEGIKRQVGFTPAVWKAADIAKAFDELGLTYPTTPKTKKPSFKAEWLNQHDDPIAKQIVAARKLDKLSNTFLQKALIEMHVDGRVYCQFHQLRSDDGGTISGRFSSSLPNLQQIPVRTAEGKMLRELFEPDDGCEMGIVDYSQIEFRLMVHDAFELEFEGGAEIAEKFRVGKPDYHQLVAEMAGVDRNSAKTINFGLAFGEGVDKLSRALGVSKSEGMALITQYHANVPFMKKLMSFFSEQARDTGKVHTLYGRLRHFNMWILRNGDVVVRNRKPVKAMERLYTYRALNARIQGSAADMMKRAMVAIHKAGLLKVLRLHLTVHDELIASVPKTPAGYGAFAEMQHIMETTSPLAIPVIAEAKLGKNWGAK